MKKFLKIVVVLSVTGAFSALAVGRNQKILSVKKWFASAPEVRGGVPKDCRMTTFTKGQVEKAAKTVWKAYKFGAIKLGWDKLPESPVTLSKTGAKNSHQLITVGTETMPFVTLCKGEAGSNGWPMFIALHGGGRSSNKVEPHGWAVNTREWNAQISIFKHLYPNGSYFIPRMANDNHGRWWFDYCLEIYDKVIKRAILFRNVDPNRVYIMGISEGGYGTYRLAPFMADVFAGGSAMAAGGLVENCPPENLLNTAFRTDVGERDHAYKHQEYAVKFHKALDKLDKVNGPGADHQIEVQLGKGHGIDYQAGPTWLVEQVRNPYPTKLVWTVQALHNSFRKNHFWLGYKKKPEAKGRFFFTATYSRANNVVKIKAEQTVGNSAQGTREALKDNTLYVYLNDKMVNLDKPVTVFLNGKKVYKKRVARKLSNLMESTAERGDPNFVFPGKIRLKIK